MLKVFFSYAFQFTQPFAMYLHTIQFFFHLLAFSWIVVDFVWCYGIFMATKYFSDLIFSPKTQHPCQNKSIWFSKDSLHSTNSFDSKQAQTYFYSLIVYLLTMISPALLLFVCVSLFVATLALFVRGLSLVTICVKAWVLTCAKLLRA
jgi:hypothetical protein